MSQDISHAELYAQLEQVKAQSAVRDGVISEMRVDVKEIRGSVAGVCGDLAALNDNRQAVHASMAKLEKAVNELIKTDARRDGRDGVWAAIARSPLFAWLAATGAAIAAAVSHFGGKSP